MNNNIIKDATAELVRKLEPRLYQDFQTEISKRTFFSIQRVAGMLEVSADAVKRHFSDKIVSVGPRQLRISLHDIDEMIEAFRRKRQSEKKRRKMETHPDLFGTKQL